MRPGNHAKYAGLRPFNARRQVFFAHRVRAFTLVEVTISMLIIGSIFAVFWLAMGSGTRGFYHGTSNVTALQDAVILMERIEMDVDAMVVPSSLKNRPVDISKDGTTLKFAIADFSNTTVKNLGLLDAVPSKMVSYKLVEDKKRKGLYHPCRNSKVYKTIDVLSWEIILHDTASDSRAMQFLEIIMKIDGVFERKPFILSRKKELVASSMAKRYGNQYFRVETFVGEPGG